MYWDTSALLKLYLPEPDSDFFLEIVRRANRPIRTSAIARVEMMCALLRKSGAPAGGDAFRRFVSDCDAARVLLLPCAGPVFGEAQKVVEAAYGRSRPVMLRSLDAIHLASAITIGATTVVATDSRLRDSAKLLGLRVIPEEVGAARVTP